MDPTNRLVATELETRWNARLMDMEDAQRKLEATRSILQPLSEAEHQCLLQLGSDLQSVWHHTATPVTLKKRLLRTVIEEIVAEMDDSARMISSKIHWVGGIHTTL